MRRGRAFAVGMTYFVTCSVLASTLPILPVFRSSVNQALPSASSAMP
jgi:hypothetical protein